MFFVFKKVAPVFPSVDPMRDNPFQDCVVRAEGSILGSFHLLGFAENKQGLDKLLSNQKITENLLIIDGGIVNELEQQVTAFANVRQHRQRV
jgi:hypothetical protein